MGGYGYQEPIPRDMFSLLVVYRQEEIFKIALKEYPMIGRYYLSPFREDNYPGCFFEWYSGKLIFKDFADTKTHRDCFSFVQDFFGIPTIEQLIPFIVDALSNNNIPQSTVPLYTGKQRKSRSELQFRAKPFTVKDNLFWKQFEITTDQLQQDNVFSNLVYRIYDAETDQMKIFRPFDLSYTIGGFEGGRIKIYNPLKKKKGKWFTNCKSNDVGGIGLLNFAEPYLLITKSYKDWRVLKNQGYTNDVWFQNEGAFPDDSILKLLSEFPRVYIFFDNDEQGHKSSIQLESLLTNLTPEVLVKRLFSPYSYLKDPSDIISVKGNQILNEFLWKNCQK